MLGCSFGEVVFCDSPLEEPVCDILMSCSVVISFKCAVL